MDVSKIEIAIATVTRKGRNVLMTNLFKRSLVRESGLVRRALAIQVKT